MLKIYHSNRVENLVERLLEISCSPPGLPMHPEIIITQSKAMAHWLFVQWAEKRGIAANIQFELPAAFIWTVFSGLFDDLTESSDFDVDVLAWKIFQCLPGCLVQPEFGELRHYLSDDNSELKRYQLACRIADIFDQYLMYRPHMLNTWESGEEGNWQPILWRVLCSGQPPPPHRARLIERFQHASDQGLLQHADLPARVSVFGINTMPPAHLDVFYRISKCTDVHFFQLNPCMLYWGDIKDLKAQNRFRSKRHTNKTTGEDDYYQLGNTLLASWGKQGQDFIDLLYHFDPYLEEELFERNAGSRLLHEIQSDILLLRDAECRQETDSQPVTKRLLQCDDNSIMIHSCHSPMREVQVLHDQLLGLFEQGSLLCPRDVVVMIPDIDRYAPYVEAVFGQHSPPQLQTELPVKSQRPSLLCSIADRARTSESPLFEVFMEMLQLTQSRFVAAEILALLSKPFVHRRFGLISDELEMIENWVMESGIRWGVDDRHRVELGLPGISDHSWKVGLDRMMLGYAMGFSDTPFAEIVPYAEIEGQNAATLGKFCQFYQRLLHFRSRMSGRLPVRGWVKLVNELIEGFFEVDEAEYPAALAIHQIKDDLKNQQQRAGFEDEFGIDMVRDFFKRRLSDRGVSQRFFTGQITFCEMLPMRSIPFKVICLLGLNDGQFPRRKSEPGFNLLREKFQPGDRSRREDDRYLFLEALLSARQHFYLSFVGKSIRDNHDLSPSIVVNELLDYIDQGFIFESPNNDRLHDKPEARQHLVRAHPLQPFDPRYFEHDSRLSSYADEWLVFPDQRKNGRKLESPFIGTSLTPPGDEMKVVELNQLIRFFLNPAEFFLRNRLGVDIPGTEESIEESEPFTLDALQTYGIAESLLNRRLKKEDLEQAYQQLKAGGNLPQAEFGKLCYQSVISDVELYATIFERYVSEPLKPLEVNLQVDEFTLTGVLNNLATAGQTRYRMAKITAKDRLALWIRHLVFCISEPEGYLLNSIHLGKDKILEIDYQPSARSHLEQLLSLYWSGLSKPLPFSPRTSYAYAEAVRMDKDPWFAVEQSWYGNAFQNFPGDASNPYLCMAFEGVNALDEYFEEVALGIFKPLLLAHTERLIESDESIGPT